MRNFRLGLLSVVRQLCFCLQAYSDIKTSLDFGESRYDKYALPKWKGNSFAVLSQTRGGGHNTGRCMQELMICICSYSGN
jgi:hypothetical protein